MTSVAGFKVWARVRTIATICVAIQAMSMDAAAQEQNRCRWLCAATIEAATSVTINNLLFPPRVAEIPDGVPQRLTRELDFELVLSADIKPSSRDLLSPAKSTGRP